MSDTYTEIISSHTDYEELRLELHINNEMAVVITQEKGIENARIEFWYPDKGMSWDLDYEIFCDYLLEMVDGLAQKKVNPLVDPKEKKSFKTAPSDSTDNNQREVKLFFQDMYLGSIYREPKSNQVRLEIVKCPYNKYWEFSYRGFIDLLNHGYQQLHDCP